MPPTHQLQHRPDKPDGKIEAAACSNLPLQTGPGVVVAQDEDGFRPGRPVIPVVYLLRAVPVASFALQVYSLTSRAGSLVGPQGDGVSSEADAAAFAVCQGSASFV